MPYDPGLARRLEELLESRSGFAPKKMFGGIGWMLRGNMCVGIYKEWLIARVGEAAAAKLLKQKHVRPMDITGKPMKGWIMAAPEAVADDSDLESFVGQSAAFVQTLPEKM